jgi:hypothetical protein
MKLFQGQELLSDSCDYLFQTPSLLKESSMQRKRKFDLSSRLKTATPSSPATPSPKRSQRLMQRRQMQKVMIQQHSKISPGVSLVSFVTCS